MPTQAPLPLSESLASVFRAEGERVLATVRETVRTLKQADDLAERLGVKPSQLSSALNNNGYHFALTWLPAILHLDRDRKVLRQLAALCGCEIRERQPLTPEERLRLLREELKRNGADVDALERRAYVEGEP